MKSQPREKVNLRVKEGARDKERESKEEQMETKESRETRQRTHAQAINAFSRVAH